MSDKVFWTDKAVCAAMFTDSSMSLCNCVFLAFSSASAFLSASVFLSLAAFSKASFSCRYLFVRLVVSKFNNLVVFIIKII